MLTIMIVCDNIKYREQIAAGIIGGFDNPVCLFSVSSAAESEEIFLKSGSHIDLFIIQIKMKNCGGHKLADRIRSTKKYRNTPRKRSFMLSSKKSYIWNMIKAQHLSRGFHNAFFSYQFPEIKF